MAVNWDALVIGPVFGVFAEPVTYTPLRKAAFVLLSGGVFDEAGKELTFNEGAAVSTDKPLLGVRLSDFAIPPAQNDTLVVRGIKFTVTDVGDDSHGWAKLSLRLAKGVH